MLGEHLQEEGLELVVGPVDLVDEQHARARSQRAQDRAGEQELGVRGGASTASTSSWSLAAAASSAQQLAGKSQS